MLGNATPAVRGLEPITFNDDGGEVFALDGEPIKFVVDDSPPTFQGGEMAGKKETGDVKAPADSSVIKFTDEQIIRTLTQGGPANTLESLMPPWGNTFTADEIEDLMNYVRALCKEADCPQ